MAIPLAGHKNLVETFLKVGRLGSKKFSPKIGHDICSVHKILQLTALKKQKTKKKTKNKRPLSP
jgi:hypothetical protein